jgi:hypothetical protein
VNENLSYIANVPGGSTRGHDHVISPVALLPYRNDSYIVCFDISKRRGGEIDEESREVSPRRRGEERRRDGALLLDTEHRLA